MQANYKVCVYIIIKEEITIYLVLHMEELKTQRYILLL